jgi:hypothetical protein
MQRGFKMVLSKVSKNQVQTIPNLPVNGRFVVQPHVWYVCPAGKKAIIKGTAVCTGLGAAASVRLNAATIRIVEWNTAAPFNDKQLPINTYFAFEIQLQAGQGIDTDQDVGTNGEVNITASVQETPL